MKKSLIVLSAVAVLFAGCTSGGEVSEKQKLLNTAAEIGCEVIKPMADMQNEENPDMEKVMTAMAEMETKMEEIVKKNGYESMEAFEEAGEKYGADEMEEEAKKAMMDKCGLDIDAIGGGM